ncbi:MAG: cell wall hydrolase [Lachnospiraceae bacterium]|nr:cell wall hydrolase [Lachnospiraceae bacterium]
MNRIQKGVLLTLTTTGILFGASQKAVAIVQAPTQRFLSVEVNADHAGKEVTLLPNPIYKEETGEQSKEVEEKISCLEEHYTLRVKEEKEEKRILRKKRLAEKRRRAEEKRRKEILACCGVSAGSEDRKILERIVEAEAGGETIHGRVLVANVILNRVKSRQFPSTIKGVVFSHSGSRYQFSPISDGRYYSVTVSKGTKKAVSLALHGNDPSEGALYFMERAYANSYSARWFDRALTRLFRYGCHEFFK